LSKNKRYYIKAEVTYEEREEYQEKASNKNMTMNSLIKNSIDNNITVNLDTSDYRDLVIQVRRIGNNINSLIRNIYYNQFFTDSDIQTIENLLDKINKTLEEERNKIDNAKEGLENITSIQVKNYLKEQEKEIPQYLIYDEIVDYIKKQLLGFIDTLEDNNFPDIYPPYITVFLEEFYPMEYEYEELVHFADDLYDTFYELDQMILSNVSDVSERDFDEVLEVLNKYRKI